MYSRPTLSRLDTSRSKSSMRVLIIAAIHYPPVIGMASRRMAYLSRALVAAGHAVEVLTIEPLEGHPVCKNSPEMTTLVPPEVVIHRVPMGLVNRLSARFKIGEQAASNGYDGNSAAAGGYVRRVLSQLYGAHKIWQPLAIPDTSADWIPAALRKGFALIRSRQFDLIISHSYPYSSHVVAYFLARRAQIAMAADYGDEWGFHPDLQQQPRLKGIVSRAIERRIVRRINRFTVSAEGMIDSFTSVYGVQPGRISLARSCFIDLDSYRRINPAPARGFTLVYTGQIYQGTQDPLPLFTALRNMTPGELSVVMLGMLRPEQEALIRSMGLSHFELRGWCSDQAEVIRQQKQASCLLLLGHSTGNQVPSKVYEYFAARRPLLCVQMDKNDLAAPLVTRHKRGLVVPNEEAAIAQALRQLLALHKNDALDSAFNLKELPEYSAEQGAVTLMHGLVDEPGAKGAQDSQTIAGPAFSPSSQEQ